LDSVQSQANRFEEALLEAHEDGRIQVPHIAVDFSRTQNGSTQDQDSEIANVGREGTITTLETPHRIADAILRDSVINGGEEDGQPFRNSTPGQAYEAADIRHATRLFELCPTALIFGVWDSTGTRGGLGNKFPRAIVSEIVGINASVGVRPSSRIDPLGIETCDLYEEAETGNWTTNPGEARQDNQGNPVRYSSKSGKGNPSAVNHGNVTPDFPRYSRNEVNDHHLDHLTDPVKNADTSIMPNAVKGGGATIDHALQTTVLSLPQLRRLRFPNGSAGTNGPPNNAARTTLAALALSALAEQHRNGFDLRSGCLLIPEDTELTIEVVRSANDSVFFSLDTQQAATILGEATKAATQAGLSWSPEPLTLRPTDRLVELVQVGREEAKKLAEPSDAAGGDE
jgi:CRISPR-associated protein Csb1